MNRLTATILVLAGLVTSSAAFAECADKYINDRDLLIGDIASASSCYEAANLAESCAWGSTADLPTTSAAISVCQRAYADKMTPSEGEMHAALYAKCDAKYGDLDGTMYRSMNGFCRLEVSKLFSSLFTPVDNQEN